MTMDQLVEESTIGQTMGQQVGVKRMVVEEGGFKLYQSNEGSK